MPIRSSVNEILETALQENTITPAEAGSLMSIDLLSPEMYSLCSAANQLSRRQFGNYGEVYAQIGLDYAPCPGNCEFCSFGASHSVVQEVIEYPIADIVQSAKICEEQGANGIYLMTTARYRFDKFLDVAQAVRQAISPELPLVANIPDFDAIQAGKLVAFGFNAVYHAIRLNESKGTALPIQQRIRTIEYAHQAGLRLHFCVEPVGPEHSVEELVDLMFLGRDLQATFSGAMRRVCVPGTPAAKYGEVTWWELARIVAVCRLVMGDTVLGHCTHEPNLPALLAGGNLYWAEMGPNPRDNHPQTQDFRGSSVIQCQNLLREVGYDVRSGPAITAS